MKAKILLGLLGCFINISVPLTGNDVIKKIYISSKSPCGAIKTGGLLTCSRTIQQKDYKKQLSENQILIIDSMIKKNRLKKTFSGKLPNNYYVGKVITDDDIYYVFFFDHTIFFAEKNCYVEIKDEAYKDLFQTF